MVDMASWPAGHEDRTVCLSAEVPLPVQPSHGRLPAASIAGSIAATRDVCRGGKPYLHHAQRLQARHMHALLTTVHFWSGIRFGSKQGSTHRAPPVLQDQT